jgi:hypothetical protein
MLADAVGRPVIGIELLPGIPGLTRLAVGSRATKVICRIGTLVHPTVRLNSTGSNIALGLQGASALQEYPFRYRDRMVRVLRLLDLHRNEDVFDEPSIGDDITSGEEGSRVSTM